MNTRADPATAPRPTTRRPNLGVGLVVLLGVNIVADLVLGRHGTDTAQATILAVLWIAWWVLAVATVVSAVRRHRRHRRRAG